jgi:hypothetical protein
MIDLSDTLVHKEYVLLHEEQIDLGAYRHEHYTAIVDADLTNTIYVNRLLTSQLEAYLNQYFSCWRLLRWVSEMRRHPHANPYKRVRYVIAVDNDADAETLHSHMVKIGYTVP